MEDGKTDIVLNLGKALPTLKELEILYIAFVLGRTDGSYTEAVRILGIDRTTLYNKARKSSAIPKAQGWPEKRQRAEIRRKGAPSNAQKAQQCLDKHCWRYEEAAGELGITVKNLRQRVNRYRLIPATLTLPPTTKKQ